MKWVIENDNCLKLEKTIQYSSITRAIIICSNIEIKIIQMEALVIKQNIPTPITYSRFRNFPEFLLKNINQKYIIHDIDDFLKVVYQNKITLATLSNYRNDIDDNNSIPF